MNYLIEPELEYLNPYLTRCGSCKYFQVVGEDADQSYGFCKLSKLNRASLNEACDEFQEEEDSFFF